MGINIIDNIRKFMQNSWMNNPQFLAQIGHFFGAYSIIITMAFLFSHMVCLVIAGLFILYAALKEFVYDANYELPKQTAADNWMDFAFYMLGVGVSLAMIFLIKPHV